MSSKNLLPSEAEIVIIGGGIIGCSLAYHLTKRGINDVVLLERKQLTCGTTWHAAGLVSMLWPTPTLTNLAKYCHELYATLEEETGQATGYKQIGSLSLARNKERLEELKRNASMAKVFGVKSEILGPEEVCGLYSGINSEGILGALYIEKDGQTNPIDTTMALAKGAQSRGARIIESAKVDRILTDSSKVCGVTVGEEKIKCRKVILTGGLWSRDIAASLDVHLPMYACEHYYVVTEEIPDLTPRPVLRDFEREIYFKEDAGKMLVGWFEKNAIGCPMSRITDDFCFDEFPTEMEHIEPHLINAMETFPPFGSVGIRTFFNGPESFTNDNLHLMGPVPEINNLFVACGMNSKGIAAAGGLGKILSDWIVDGYPSGEVTETDVRRNNSVQTTQSYVEARIPEALGHTYAMHWPFYQYKTARNLWKSPLHKELASQGACFGEVGGYERPNWFAHNGIEPTYKYTYRKQNWLDCAAAEHISVRESVGLYDISSFGKFEISGVGALSTLQRLSCANTDVEVGKVVYTQWLNDRGGIEADLTIARLEENRFWIITGIGSLNRDWWRLKHHLEPDVKLTDLSMSYACLALQGPNSGDLLQPMIESDLTSKAFNFGTGKFSKLNGKTVWIQRLSYVGELGWEIFIPSESAVNVLKDIQLAGKAFDLSNVGLHAVNSLRLEKGFRHWGHDIGTEDNLHQAGLSFTAKPDASDFIGRDAFLRSANSKKIERRLVQFALQDPDLFLYHNEPILVNEAIVGYLTSAMYGHSIGSSIGMGYVNLPNLSEETLLESKVEIEIATERHAAKATLKPLYDPSGEKMRQ